MSVAREFSKVLTGASPAGLPDMAVRNAAMLVASSLASAALGVGIPSATIVRGLARERGGSPQASVWFGGGLKLPVGAAAWANAVTADASASDDSDLRNIMHLGTPLVATALAVGEQEGASGRDVLAAIVLGYEAAGRMSEAVPGWRKRGFHGSTLTIFAVAVAAGRLLRLSVDQMTHNLSLAATSTGTLTAAAWTSIAREYNGGRSVASGIETALLAQRGFTAEEDVFELPGGFFETFSGADPTVASDALFRDFGAAWDITTDMAIKLVPGGHPFHAFAQAGAEAARAAGASPDEIEAIVVSRPGLTKLPEPIHPKDLVDMAHSPAYFAAAGVADKDFSWIHASPDKIADPTIHRLIDRLVVGPEPTEHAAAFRHGARVTIRTTAGREFTATVHEPHGSARLGLEWDALEAKYRALMPLVGLSGPELDETFRFVRDLADAETLGPLVGRLGAARDLQAGR